MRQGIKEMIDYLVKYIEMLKDKDSVCQRSKCSCNNSVFWDGIRYCPDCNTHSAAPTQDELNKEIEDE